MSTKNLLFIGLGLLAYFYFTNPSAIGSNFMTCRYPDGTTIKVPVGNACPYDVTHGGQSVPCYPSSFVGPLPPGSGGYC